MFILDDSDRQVRIVQMNGLHGFSSLIFIKIFDAKVVLYAINSQVYMYTEILRYIRNKEKNFVFSALNFIFQDNFGLGLRDDSKWN